MTVCAKGRGENLEQELVTQDIKGFAQTINELKVVNASGPYERLPRLRQLLDAGGVDDTGRRYFEYQSPLRTYPLNSNSVQADMNMLRLGTSEKVGVPGYTIEIQLKIFRGNEPEPINNSTYRRKIPSGGYYLRDLREEATVKYTVQRQSNALGYGQYLIGSAIVDQQEHPELFRLIEEFLASSQPTDFPSLSVMDSFVKNLQKIEDMD
jgi:hypothetical protein